ncbi:bifunctional precorrin-2 dehydrogenase/sirohydrochlorin ferrochelatase [Methanolapillus ohkumae]|uniref:precorrin-2 dehydrogenase n=1 Tax=Methanolapillus ohkumae TaxID=3028298 RepID=A0AA96V7V3_9EURY|nr:Siroheme synthase [Methanosarcinaceae archaeon Am2]
MNENMNEYKEISNPYLPLFIDFSEKPVLIFGGGTVGERKALRFMKSAPVTVVSLRFTDLLLKNAQSGQIQILEKDISKMSDADLKTLMKGVFLVVAATPSNALNDRISKIAKSTGILVNHAGGADAVVIPSLIEKNGLSIAISSGGESPAVTKYVRIQIEKTIGSDFEKMILIQNEMREELKKTIPDQKKRQAVLWEIMDSDEIWELLKSDSDADFEKAKKKAYEIVKNV